MRCTSFVETLFFTLTVHWTNPASLGASGASNFCPDNVGCQHGCLLIDNRPQCICYRGYSLQTDGQSCKPTMATRNDGRRRSTSITNQIDTRSPHVQAFRVSQGCRENMCTIHSDKREPSNSEKSCPPNFKIVENNGFRTCVWQGNRSVYQILTKNNPSTRTIEKLANKDMGKHTENIRVGRSKLTDRDNKIKRVQHLAILQKYNEDRRKHWCQEDEVLVLTIEGAICRKECKNGQIVSESGKQCLNPPSKVTGKVCPVGHKPTQTTIGIVCEKIPESSRLASSSRCTANERLIHLQTGSICVRGKSRRPICKDGEDLIQQGKEFYCVLSRSKGNSKCSSQEEEIQTDRGSECRPIACPEGLAPFRTPAGIVCRFVTHNIKAPRLNTEKTTCSQGQILVQTEKGEECWFSSDSSTLETKCPPGQVLVGGTTCKDPRLLSPDETPCPIGQELVMTSDGVQCQYRRPRHGDLFVQRTRCPKEKVLAVELNRFVCQTVNRDLSGIICDSDEVVVQGPTDIIECVSEDQTNLVCEHGKLLTRTSLGYTCDQGTTEFTTNPRIECDQGQVFIVDEDGARCVTVEEESHLCGPGHQAIQTTAGEVVCRKLSTLLAEPSSIKSSCNEDCFESNCDKNPIPGQGKGCADIESLRHVECLPECANGGSCENGRCVCPSGLSGPACHDDVDECALLPTNHCQFSCRNTFGSYHCVCLEGFTLGPDKRTCIEEHAHCFPGCMNGGMCRRGKCRCPHGFSGGLCQEDVNECLKYTRLCEHQCRNTYGSYLCTCPPGSRLREDKRTCHSSTCKPNCINGGVCDNNRCRCPSGYYGIICQLDLDECYSNPCRNKCVNTIGSYYCTG